MSSAASSRKIPSPQTFKARPQPSAIPPPSAKQKLGYKNVERRVLAAMVAAPIALVTSWVLWERCTFTNLFSSSLVGAVLDKG